MFTISMHAICISDKSFVQLQRHTFNRNGVTSRTKFSYTGYQAIQSDYRKTKKLSSAHRKRISLVHSPSIRTSFFWGSSLCCIFYTGASFCPMKGKLSLRKQQILSPLVKNVQKVVWYCHCPQVGSKFQKLLLSSLNLTISKSISSWSRPFYYRSTSEFWLTFEVQ